MPKAKVISFANQKGGVGKTTSAINVGHGLTLKGKEVLLIDLDPQGQSAISIGLLPEDGAASLLSMGLAEDDTNYVSRFVKDVGRAGDPER